MKGNRKEGNKRIIILVLICIFAISMMAGCGKASEENSSEKTLDAAKSSNDVEDKQQVEEVETEDVLAENEMSNVENLGESEDKEEIKEESKEDLEDNLEDKIEENDKTENIEIEDKKENTQADVQNDNKNSTEKNQIGKDNSKKEDSKNKESQNNKIETGLGKDGYIYITTQNPTEEKEVKLAKEIVKKIIKSGMSDYEKVKAINDYMILNVSYDMENYKKNTIPYESYTALGALEKKVAVCSGYAKMFRLVASEAGLEVTYVTGDTPYGSHAWNQVKVDGKWYNIDVTWNDGDYEKKENGHYYCGCYEYFLLSNEDFNKSHIAYNKTYETGNSRDLEAYKQGCPYDGATPCYEGEEGLDKLIKEMIASNTTTKRITTNDRYTEKSLTSILKKNGIYGTYGKFKVNIKDEVPFYRANDKKIYKLTIDIDLKGASYKELKAERISSVSDAKKVLDAAFKKYVAEKRTGDSEVYLYVGTEYVNNQNFRSELMRWACYEKKMWLNFYDNCEEIEKDVYAIEIEYSSIEDGGVATEIIFDKKDIEAAVKRMFKCGYKGIVIELRPSNKLTGGVDKIEKEYREICQTLNKKYCMTNKVSIDVENNLVSIVFYAKGHDVENCYWEVEKEATCSAEGVEVKICRICEKAGAQQAIPKNDNHSYYWDQKGDCRTRKCKLCSYVGITEVCIGGVWGYFDEDEAKEMLIKINNQRASIKKTYSDYMGNCIGVITPPALVVNNDLVAYAKERLVVLNETDFESFIDNEDAERWTPYSKIYQKKYGSGADVYHEKYSEIGIICFKFDHYDDASKFGIIYIIELKLAEEVK